MNAPLRTAQAIEQSRATGQCAVLYANDTDLSSMARLLHRVAHSAAQVTGPTDVAIQFARPGEWEVLLVADDLPKAAYCSAEGS